jgi:hypothetical protein
VAELQLHQAKQMLSRGGPMSSLAAALLSSAIQQLSSGDLLKVAAVGGAHAPGLKAARQRVLALLCKAHLAGGEAGPASKVLDALEAEAPDTITADPDMQMVYMQAKLESGRVHEALRFLVALMQPTASAPSATTASAPPAFFLAGLHLALPHLSDDTLPSFQSAVNAFVWKFTAAASPTHLLHLVRMLLAQDKVGYVQLLHALASNCGVYLFCQSKLTRSCRAHLQAAELCQKLALQVLVSEDVSAAIRADLAVQKQVHSLLFHTAAHHLQASSCPAATELLKAALHYAGSATRARTARALAVCHTRLQMHQRAAEYLEIAARHEHQPSSLTHLARLHVLAQLGDVAQVSRLA